MKGYGPKALAAIDVELKEAVCDAVVNTIVRRVSGTDEQGRFIFERSPRRCAVSGQLLPRFDLLGQDETSDIRIAALGLDFLLAEASAAPISARPHFSVYVRVLPSWEDIEPGKGPLEVDFRLNAAIHQLIEDNIRTRRHAAFTAAKIDTPDWRSMEESERSKVREQRAKIQEEVRIGAYREQGINLKAGDLLAQGDGACEVAPVSDADDPNTGDQPPPPQPPIARLLREGREIPYQHLDPAPIPPKWERLDLDLPTFEWPANAVGSDLAARTAEYNQALGVAIAQQLQSWLQGRGQTDAWRDLTVLPGDASSRENWEIYLVRARAVAPSAQRLLPYFSRVVVKVERQIDFLDSSRASFRVALDNQSFELTGRDAASMCDTIFGVKLEVSVPRRDHRDLKLDRVEPSYRFRDYLNYPAIGLNCGVEAHPSDDLLRLTTTWSPRFVQPRIVPTQLNVETNFVRLADPNFPARDLLTLPREYKAWVTKKKAELEEAVRAGLSEPDADLESNRLKQDTAGQLAEAAFVEKGVRLLTKSKEAADQIASAATSEQKETLRRRAIPWHAWTLTNEAFARRDGRQSNRGWRLFQLAFILAHIPTFASRLEEYRDFQDAVLDEESASLLYFPTGGGKSEAFYGALLFAIYLDRLRGKDRGITALIRYPLRLLTLQQAQRLLKLIVHAEIVRKDQGAGAWPIEIGFWVGSANTPNTYSGIRADVPKFGDADHPDDTKLEEEAPGTEEEREVGRKYREIRDAFDKIPECPICQKPTGLRRNESEVPSAKRAAIVCFNPKCDWNLKHGGIHPLPFLLTDDTIYERAPAIVLGTVDKLAMLGQHTGTVAKVLGMFGLARWIDRSGHLQSERRLEKLRSGPEAEGFAPVFPAYRRGNRVFYDPFPTLIIQDEAHLLEESLGTFSGLFDTLLENALTEVARVAGDDLQVSRVWTGDGWAGPRMPKIIAATATISNPERQIETLYQRKPLRFPYPGPDIYRSFFAEPASPPRTNADRVRLSKDIAPHLSPEATAPWTRLYVSLMTNGATHTVTAVQVLSAFHTIITQLWVDLLDPGRRDAAVARLRAAISPGRAGDWHRAAIDRATAEGRFADVLALVDLHRIALAYVTNKKGGDQVIDALDAAVRIQHEEAGTPLQRFRSRLISGGVDMKEIQSVMNDAGESFEERDYPSIDGTLRNIVATAAISHGVDVDRFNSMFFAGLPSDIAEYIQASSRVGRTHVGFVMLIPTPQNRRDRYVVETHDIFHRFLERMIAPPAVERWAENAVRRVLASFLQTWTMLKEAEQFVRLDDSVKSNVVLADMVSRLRAQAVADIVAFQDDVGTFILKSAGYRGRGASELGRPHYRDHYRGLVDHSIQRFAQDMTRQNTAASLRDYWDGQTAVFQKPMTSLRDVDEAGYIVASGYDPFATERSMRVNRQDLAIVMRAIRSQKGDAAETDHDGGTE